MSDKLELLRRFIAGEYIEVDEIEWNHIGTVLMRGVHIERMLSKYVNKEVTPDFLQTWASYILTREDIIYEEKNESIIHEVLDILATQNIQEKLSKSVIEGIFIAIE